MIKVFLCKDKPDLPKLGTIIIVPGGEAYEVIPLGMRAGILARIEDRDGNASPVFRIRIMQKLGVR